ncbi:hypothetical protein OROMI_023718 [Orobanche minor]
MIRFDLYSRNHILILQITCTVTEIKFAVCRNPDLNSSEPKFEVNNLRAVFQDSDGNIVHLIRSPPENDDALHKFHMKMATKLEYFEMDGWKKDSSLSPPMLGNLIGGKLVLQMEGRDDDIYSLKLTEIGKIEEEARLIDQRNEKEDRLTDYVNKASQLRDITIKTYQMWKA